MPVGFSLITKGIIYPYIIGNDIGCGMSLYNTNIDKKKLKLDRWVVKLNHIKEFVEVPFENPYSEKSPILDLGTIGSGNHFAEFQFVDEIYDEDEFQKLNMGKDYVFLLVHSGSRGFGQSIFKKFNNYNGYLENSVEADDYIEQHNEALLWAGRNRDAIACKLLEYLGYSTELYKIIDCVHNFLQKREGLFIHRKGAVSSENGVVIIPGSRGALSYVVKPIADVAKMEESAYSLSHGAGRKWARSLCKSRIKDKYNRDTIRQNKYKGKTVCHDTDLLFEEAPEAYKNIDNVIQSLLDYELISVVATLKPVLTYKG